MNLKPGEMGKKTKEITVLGSTIAIDKDDYISLSDMIKARDGDFFISDWLRNRNTLEYLGIWERIHNPDFNYGEFATIKVRENELILYFTVCITSPKPKKYKVWPRR